MGKVNQKIGKRYLFMLVQFYFYGCGDKVAIPFADAPERDHVSSGNVSKANKAKYKLYQIVV